jgi:hypothetical protein
VRRQDHWEGSAHQSGEIIADQSRKDPIRQTGAYFLDYVWQRPDGAQVTVSQVGPSVAQFPWTSDRVTALLALPAWDQAVARLKALLADAGSTSGS